jgi:hypothetical protein
MRAVDIFGFLAIAALITGIGFGVAEFANTGPKFTCKDGQLYMRLATTNNIYQPTNQACVVATPK